MRINRLSRIIKRRVGKDLKAVLNREINEKDYHPQKDYGNCQERSEALWSDASKRAVKMLTAAIARHRIEKHGEARGDELIEAEDGLSKADLVATARSSWWRG